MDRQSLRRLDLNLLLAFDVLIAECSVTRAAQRMSIGQPAMSASLARLRKFFDDPILVRNGRALVPTTRALMLIGPIRDALNSIESTVRAGQQFEPEISRRTFTIMASDYVLLLLLGPLLAALNAEAPSVQFRVSPVRPDFAAAIEKSQLDLLIYPDELVPADLQARSVILFTDRLVCAIDRDHPEVGERMTEEQFRTLPCISFGGSPTHTINEERLRELGIQRPVEILAQSFVAQPLMLPGTRLMATVPERLGRHFADQIGVRLLDPPLALSPLREAMFWSPRSDADPAHRWLRDRVQAAAAELDR